MSLPLTAVWLIGWFRPPREKSFGTSPARGISLKVPACAISPSLGLPSHCQAANGRSGPTSSVNSNNMKDIQDRARTLFRCGVAISDPHAPMEYSLASKKLIGRVLLNSEDERTGALQTIFETTEGKIEIIRHDAPLRSAWARGDLQPGNIVVIDSLRSNPEQLYASIGRQGQGHSCEMEGTRFHRAPDARHESLGRANPTKVGWGSSTKPSVPG